MQAALGFTSECIWEGRRDAPRLNSALSFGLRGLTVNHHSSSVQDTNANLAEAHGGMTPG